MRTIPTITTTLLQLPTMTTTTTTRTILLPFLLCCSRVRVTTGFQEVQFLAGSRRLCHFDTFDEYNPYFQIEYEGFGEGTTACLKVRVEPSSQCLRACLQDMHCVGVTVDDEQRAFCVIHHDDASSPQLSPGREHPPVCSPAQLASHPYRRFYSKQCAHDGRWAPYDNTCRCVYGWVGPRCQDRPNG